MDLRTARRIQPDTDRKNSASARDFMNGDSHAKRRPRFCFRSTAIIQALNTPLSSR